MGDLSETGMILRTSLTSPFGRKVRIVALRLGLGDRLTLVEPALLDPADPLRKDNPLGKIPCLVLCDGTAVFDSSVIVEYLDRLAGGVLLPIDPDRRIRTLVTQALADGLTDAAVAMGAERMFHPEEHVSEKWLAHQVGKVERALDAFAMAPPLLDPCGVDAISLACALGYLDWRKPMQWRETHPSLAQWLDSFSAAVPEFALTQA
jgi:glutathione S-transferase